MVKMCFPQNTFYGHFWKLFLNPQKLAFFGQIENKKKWPGNFCPTVPNFFASKIGVKLPPEKKVP